VGHEGEFCSKHPPFTFEGQIPTLDLFQSNILPPANLGDVFSQPSAQGSLASRGPSGCLADINQSVIEVEGVDSASLWPDSSSQIKKWTGLKLGDDLGSDTLIQIEIEVMRVVVSGV
jgi:hypothetical protein